MIIQIYLFCEKFVNVCFPNRYSMVHSVIEDYNSFQYFLNFFPFRGEEDKKIVETSSFVFL